MTSAFPSPPRANSPHLTSPLAKRSARTQRTPHKVGYFTCVIFLLALQPVTSIWQYARESAIGVQDKDFKRLNKSALGNRATTAHLQYLHRKQSDIRIRHPSQIRAEVSKKAQNLVSAGAARYGGSGRHNVKRLNPPMTIPSDSDETFTYGAPLRPSTPIKAVIGNFYGEIAGFQHTMKTTNFRELDESFRVKMLNPPKSHTRASAMATSFVNDRTIAKISTAPDATKSLFKMKKFLDIEPRTSSKNANYVPTKRDTSNIGMRPNPVIGGR